MSKREKIILAITLAVVLYGLIDFLVLTPKNKDRKVQQLTTSTNEISTEFISNAMLRISNIERQTKHPHRKELISKIESPWEQDPFVQPLVHDTDRMTASASLLSKPLTYSGYIFAEKIALAVINGYEYSVGDVITGYSYKIIHIDSQKVILKNNQSRINIFFNEE